MSTSSSAASRAWWALVLVALAAPASSASVTNGLPSTSGWSPLASPESLHAPSPTERELRRAYRFGWTTFSIGILLGFLLIVAGLGAVLR